MTTKKGYIEINDAKKLYELQNEYFTTPIMMIGTVNMSQIVEDNYRNYFDDIIKKYKIDTTNLQGIMPDGQIQYFTKSSEKNNGNR